MSSVGSIVIRRPGERAQQLVALLRAKAQQYSVGIEHGPGTIMIVDRRSDPGDLAALLRDQLDACSRELGLDWRDYMTVTPTGQSG
jgi:hypothetical protein